MWFIGPCRSFSEPSGSCQIFTGSLISGLGRVAAFEWKRLAHEAFKRASDKDKLEAGVRDALKQIEEKKYDTHARKEGYKRILRVGIAFCGKSVKVGFEEVRGEAGNPAP